jgi:hypothetical protein
MAGLSQHRFRYVAVGLLSAAFMSIGSALAWADESITLDIVRHAQSVDDFKGILDTVPPGTNLTTPEGVMQADQLAGVLASPNSYNGIYASDLVRTQDTAMDWLTAAGAPSTPVTDLSGLNEIPAGIFTGAPTDSLQALLYYLGPVAWTLGLVLVPDLGDPSVNGITFDESFGGAVQTIYDNTVSGGPSLTDVAFSSEGAMAVWTLMNVNNPDFSVVLQTLLTTGQLVPNTGQIVVEGSPGDWTLVSYDGTAVPQDPGLPTELFVDFRNLIEAPQFAAYNILEALLTGNPTTIVDAIGAGLNEVGTATLNFPISVIDDLVGALQGDIPSALANLGAGLNPGDLAPDLASLLPTLATDVAGLLPGELGTMITPALTMF